MAKRFLVLSMVILVGVAAGYAQGAGASLGLVLALAAAAVALIAVFVGMEVRRSGWGDPQYVLKSAAFVVPLVAVAIAVYPKAWPGWIGIGCAAVNFTAFALRQRATREASAPRRTAARP